MQKKGGMGKRQTYCSAELRRGVAESRRVKAVKLRGSLRVLSGSLRNHKKCKKGGGGDHFIRLLACAYKHRYISK